MIAKFSKPPKFWNQPRSRKKKRWPLLRSSLSDYFCWTILYETRLPDAQDAKNWQRYARIAWEILRRNFIQSKLSTNWSPRKDQGATTGLLCVLQNGSPIFHSFLDTMLTQNIWCWWAGGVPWGHHFVGSNPHGCYHFVGVPIPFCRGGRLGTLHFGRPNLSGRISRGIYYMFLLFLICVIVQQASFKDVCRFLIIFCIKRRIIFS